jgi:3-deoxy-D-manno-octulosonic-acid transferase
MYFLYSALLAVLLLVTLPYWLLRMAQSGKYRRGMSDRLGDVPLSLRATGAAEDCIWIHAVSVGEVIAITPLAKAMQAKFPGWRIVISTTTLTGNTLARERFGEENSFYFPLDFGFAVRPYLRQLRPRLVMLAETEFWPNFLHEAKRSGARIAVVNARISDRSFPRYQSLARIGRAVLKNVDLFLAQSEEDRSRLIAIGADSAKLHVTGNLKFDSSAPPKITLVDALATAMSDWTVKACLVCGSTVEGEEPLLLNAFQAVLRAHPDTLLVLAPRHPERFAAVAEMVKRSRLPLIMRTEWTGSEELKGSVFLLNTIGELAAMYQLATLAFVGGSLVPRGGHNILEPARAAKAILVGPHTENFRDIVRIFQRADAVRIVPELNLIAEMLLLLADVPAREALGQHGKAIFEANAGALQRTLDALEVLLWKPSTLGASQPRSEVAQ